MERLTRIDGLSTVLRGAVSAGVNEVFSEAQRCGKGSADLSSATACTCRATR